MRMPRDNGQSADRPQIPAHAGIDLAGRVLRSEDSRFQAGDGVGSPGNGSRPRELTLMTSRARLDDVTSLAVEILAGKTRGGWSSISEQQSVRCATANIGWYYLLDRFRLNL